MSLRILELLESDPEKAVSELERMLPSTSGASRHAALDGLVGALLSFPARTRELEVYVRELIAIDRDATHLLLFAQVRELAGEPLEAEKLRAEAKLTPDRHVTDEMRRIAGLAGVDLSWMD